MDYLEIIDRDDVKQDMDWLHQNYGPMEFGQSSGDGTYMARQLLEDKSYSNALVVRVLDENWEPVEGERVAFYWPDAPVDEDSGWYGQCVVCTTNSEGNCGFGMGGGAYYKPNETRGPHAAWIYGDGKSDMVDGLGMIYGTNHEHMNVVFVLRAGNGEPPPDPCEFDFEGLLSTVDSAISSQEMALAEMTSAKSVIEDAMS